MKNHIGNILVVTSWDFESALIKTYTLPYVLQIKNIQGKNSLIYLYTLNPSKNKNNKQIQQDIEELKKQGVIIINGKYRSFGILALFNYFFEIVKLISLCKKNNIRNIHAWCTPAGAMAYLISKFHKARFILDSFEPHAEPMAEGNTWKKNSLAFKLLFFLEKKQLESADEVICANEGMIPYSQKTYGIKKPRYFVKPACVDLNKFSLSFVKNKDIMKELGLGNEHIICVYAGKFGGLYLTVETFQFFKTAHNFWGDKFRVLLLTNHTKNEILNYSKAADFPSNYIIQKYVSHDTIAVYMGVADFAICPMKPLPSRKFGAPIKTGEYMAMGLPTVITKNIANDSDIIEKNKAGSVLSGLTEEGYMKSLKEIDFLLQNEEKENMRDRIRNLAIKYHNFEEAEKIYTEIYGN